MVTIFQGIYQSPLVMAATLSRYGRMVNGAMYPGVVNNIGNSARKKKENPSPLIGRTLSRYESL